MKGCERSRAVAGGTLLAIACVSALGFVHPSVHSVGCACLRPCTGDAIGDAVSTRTIPSGKRLHSC